jgi:hypothetical protein
LALSVDVERPLYAGTHEISRNIACWAFWWILDIDLFLGLLHTNCFGTSCWWTFSSKWFSELGLGICQMG